MALAGAWTTPAGRDRPGCGQQGYCQGRARVGGSSRTQTRPHEALIPARAAASAALSAPSSAASAPHTSARRSDAATCVAVKAPSMAPNSARRSAPNLTVSARLASRNRSYSARAAPIDNSSRATSPRSSSARLACAPRGGRQQSFTVAKDSRGEEGGNRSCWAGRKVHGQGCAPWSCLRRQAPFAWPPGLLPVCATSASGALETCSHGWRPARRAKRSRLVWGHVWHGDTRAHTGALSTGSAHT